MAQPEVWLACSAGAAYWLQIGGQSASESGTFSLWESGYRHFNLTPSAPCPFKPSPPTEPRLYPARAGNGEIGPSWVEPYWDGGRSVDITRYNVYRAPTCAGPFAFVGSTAYRRYTDRGLRPAPTSATRPPP